MSVCYDRELCKKDEPIEISFGVQTREIPRHHVLRKGKKVTECQTPWWVYAGCSSPFLRPWACMRKNDWSLWRMASAMPDLRLPSQPQGITPFDRYQIILLGHRSRCVRTTYPRLLRESGTAEIRTRDLSTRTSNALTTTPPGVLHRK